MTCSRCGLNGIHACPGEPLPAWDRAKLREFQRILRGYEAPMSRNAREGHFIGHWKGHAVRSRVRVEVATDNAWQLCALRALQSTARKPRRLPWYIQGRMHALGTRLKVRS